MATKPKPQTITYQGIPGAYSFIVASKLFPQATLQGCQTFEQVFKSLKQKQAHRAVLPIENSIAGSVTEVADLLTQPKLSIKQEVNLQINHHLLSLPQVKMLEEITHVHSHPKALEQCQEFFKAHPHLVAVPEFDTAGSAQMVATRNDPHHAAIASKTAAKLWSLKVFASKIQSHPHNFTRFIVINPTPPKLTSTGKTSLVFTIPHVAGSLVKAMEVFSKRKISMTKIESRPLIGKPWEYRFFVDIKNNATVETAIKELRKHTTSLQLLGSYPTGITIKENSL